MATKKDPEKMTEIVYVEPRHRDEDSIFVGVNGRKWQVKTGENVEVPIEVADAIKCAKRQRKAADEYIRANKTN